MLCPYLFLCIRLRFQSFYFSFFFVSTPFMIILCQCLYSFFSFLRSFFCPRVSPLRCVFVFPVYIIYDTVISFCGCRSFHWLSLFLFCILVFFLSLLSLLSFPLCSLSFFVSLSVLFFVPFLVFLFPCLFCFLFLFLFFSLACPSSFDLVLLFSPSFLFFFFLFFVVYPFPFFSFPFLLFVFVFLSCFRVVFLDLRQFDIKLSLFFEFFLKIIWFVSVKFLPLHPLSGLKPCRALRESSLTD